MMNDTLTSENRARTRYSTKIKGVNISPELVAQFSGILKTVGFTVGPALVAFNIFNFNIAKIGYFYKDPARFGIAIGVFLIATAWYLGRQGK